MRASACNVKLMPGIEEMQITVNDKWVRQRLNEIAKVRRAVLKAGMM